MEDILFTQKYYFYLIAFFIVIILFSLFSYLKQDNVKMIPVIVFLFSLLSIIYIGNRDYNVGVDTIRYKRAFDFYKDRLNFEIRKDLFYDMLSFVFAKLSNFSGLLVFCAFVYISAAVVGLKKIFGVNSFLPLLIFLISPYFIANGISAIRSGVAASLFLFGLGIVYEKNSFKKAMPWFAVGVLFHVSMIVPLIFFIISRYYQNTKMIFLIWIGSIFLGFLKINVIIEIVDFIGIFESRIGDYAVNEGERNFWTNFLIFGFGPVVFAIYNILYLKYNDPFYKWLVNSYMFIHIPYIILIESEYGLRLGYLAEFMLPILLMYPLLINSKLNFRLVRFKLSIVIFGLFLIKAYKILIV